jgi:WD40 repeat protein
VATGACIRTFEGDTSPVVSLLFSVDGSSTISGSADRTIRMWAIAPGDCTAILQQHQHWGGSQDETIQAWHLETVTHLKTLRCPRPYESMIIADTTDLTEAQKVTLQALGAIAETKTIPTSRL